MRTLLSIMKCPRFYYTNTDDKLARQRIKSGLEIAYADGSMYKLWVKYFGESIRFVDLPNRKMFDLKNSSLEGLDPDYKKYYLVLVE